ncbi:MAG TPA: methyltransferase domain-containing protein, partial [Methanomicrobiales archaeon]|nr:methyltransferase domain-containing protein [Methanomicrobiales archaeon]
DRLADLLHGGTRYPAGSRVLEAACGVGAQTVILARNSTSASFVSIDVSRPSLLLAEERVRGTSCSMVFFHQADVYHLPFRDEIFDHIFVCFLLEHLADPILALESLKAVLRPGGTITVIEGDHGSALFYPESPDANRVIGCLVDIQASMGGNACIGRKVLHLLQEAGFSGVTISPLTICSDGSHPESREAVRKIFIAMVEGVREEALARGLVDAKSWEKGMEDLRRTTEPGGMFCYTFFKAIGVKE